MLEAAGFPDGVDITANSSNIYGPGFGRQMEAVAASAGQAGFRMQLNLGEYGGYLSTTFLGDIPPNQIGLAPLMGSPIDPHNIFFSIFHPTSGRHNWGPKGPVPAAELPARTTHRRPATPSCLPSGPSRRRSWTQKRGWSW